MESGTTIDAVLGGALRLVQPARGQGYRFNVDALLLAREALGLGFAPRALDLGAGCGVVGLALLAQGGCGEVVLVERDPWMASLAATNAASYPGASALNSSVERLPALAPFDLVLSNPPYTPPDDGRPCPEPRRAQARRGPVTPFVEAASRLLGAGGLALFIYPAQGVPALLAGAVRSGLGVSRLRFVHPAPGAAARVALVGMRAGASSLEVAAPWFEREPGGP